MTILLTGATGTLGPHIASALVRRGIAVRALVRDPDRGATRLPAQVELVRGTFGDEDLLLHELETAESMLLLTPHGPDMAATQIALIDLAVRTGTRVVKVSGTSAGIRPDGPDACRQHHEAEEHLAAAGVPWATVRPNGFMQTLLPGLVATVREKGSIVNPIGSAGVSIVDCADLGDAIAAVLTNGSHDGRNHVMTGPEAPTFRQIASAIERESGRPVNVVDVAPEQVGAATAARGASAWEARHLAEMLTLFATGAVEYVTDDIRLLTGAPPRAVADFLRDHRDLFGTPHEQT